MPDSRWHAPDRPHLRADLQCKRTKQGRSVLYKVKAPESESVCLLHEVEISVLKLMDGNRNRDQIVAQSTATGLPMTGVQLEKFLRELAAYNFIQNAEPLPPWSPSSFVEPAVEPASGEEFFGSLAARVPQGQDDSDRWSTLTHGAERVKKGWSLAWAWLQARIVTLRSVPAFARAVRWMTPRRAGPIGLGILGLAVVLAILRLVHVPIHGEYPGQVSSVTSVDLHLPCDAVVAQIDVRAGQRVARGDVIGRIDRDALQLQLTGLRASFERVQQEVALMRRGTDPNVVDDERRHLREAEAQLQGARRNRGTAKADRAERVRQWEQRVAASRKNLALLAKASEEGAIVRKELEADQLRMEERRVSEATQTPELRASLSGMVKEALPPERAGSWVRAAETFARIAPAQRLEAAVWVPESDRSKIGVGAPLGFTPEGSGVALRGTVMGIDSGSRDGSTRVVAEIEDPAGLLQPGTRGSARIEVGRRSVLSFASR